MRWAEKLVLRFRSLFSRTRVEQELDDELRFHLEQQIEENLADGMTLQIVGLFDDIEEGPLEGATWPALYVPFNHNPVAWPALLIRTAQREASLFPEMVAAIHGIDPFISVYEPATMTERINQSPSAYLHRSSASLVGAFAVAAFVLSIVGLYGVVAYSVSQRTREIGICMALGAQRKSVYNLIVKEAGWLTLAGIAIGLVCSVAAATLMRSLLFGIRSWDIPTLVVVASAVAVSATKVDPMVALRYE